MVILRQVLEMYAAVFTSGWFWLLYTVVGIRVCWNEWDEFSDDIGRILASVKPFGPHLAAAGLLLWFGMWPWLAFWQAVRRVSRWGWIQRVRSTRR